jgi:hypothetical protein
MLWIAGVFFIELKGLVWINVPAAMIKLVFPPALIVVILIAIVYVTNLLLLP